VETDHKYTMGWRQETVLREWVPLGFRFK
jgi:hypothetical protein